MKYGQRVLLFLCLLTLTVMVLQGCSITSAIESSGKAYSHVIVSNPYESIDWETTGFYDANFHAHTTISDGRMKPEEITEAYYRKGYRVLALTDHDYLDDETGHHRDVFSYPEKMHGILEEPSMLVLIGSELSQGHHMNSLFITHRHIFESEQEGLLAIQEGQGLAFFNHPGRYRLPASWYVNLYLQYDCLFALEVFNRKDRYPHDRQLWDAILYHLMPDRPVWAVANDDTHVQRDIGYNRNLLLMERLDAASVRRTLKGGSFYLFRPDVRGERPKFFIRTIETDEAVIRINVDGGAYVIRWITHDPTLGKSRTLSSDDMIDLTTLPLATPFVRAEITGPGGIIYTQPFGLAYKPPQSQDTPSDCCR